MTGGYVLIYRALLDNPTFRDASEAMFFAYLILKANWRDGLRRYDDRIYDLKRGDFVLGARKLAAEYGCSHKRIRNLIKRLKDAKMIIQIWAQHGAQRAPVTSICNYEDYQVPLEEGAQGGARGGHKGGTPKNKGNTKKEEKTHTVASLTPRQFDQFWRIFPSRRPHANPKAPARKKYEAAINRGVSPADILRGAENFAVYVEREQVEPRFIAQAVTWLSQERWTDYQEPPAERQQEVAPL